jgi:hypothetical protein
MGMRVLRLSHTSGEWRVWGGDEVEGRIEFTRKVGRAGSDLSDRI